jgi:hypothetical protein
MLLGWSNRKLCDGAEPKTIELLIACRCGQTSASKATTGASNRMNHLTIVSNLLTSVASALGLGHHQMECRNGKYLRGPPLPRRYRATDTHSAATEGFRGALQTRFVSGSRLAAHVPAIFPFEHL